MTPELKQQMLVDSLKIKRASYLDKIHKLNIELKQIESNLMLLEDILLGLKPTEEKIC